MILAVDIGNTTTNFGSFEGGKLRAQFTVGTQPSHTLDEITLQIGSMARAHGLAPKRAKEVVVCSVVPRMSALLIQALESMGAGPVRVVGQDVRVPLVNRYRYPEQVGQDRLVGAYAAWKGLKRACIVADFGTAITIDVVNRGGEYLGGIIAPGLDLSLEALAARTALLPKVELRAPPELLGRDTANSIRSGVLHGCAALCDGLVSKLKEQYAPGALVVATGGAGKLIASHARSIDIVRPHLVLEGLYALLGQYSKPRKGSKSKRLRK